MAIVAGDFVRVTINGTDRTDFVVEYGRYSSLCELGQSFSLVLSHDYPVALGPYDDIVIREWYDGDLALVLRGFAITIDQTFDGNFKIQGQDKSVLLFDYFIPTQIKSQGESVDFWMDFYADQVGLTIEFQASSAFSVVAPETQMGMQTAGDGILTMERLAAYFTKYDSTSDKLIAFRLGSSEPVITIDTITEGKRLLGTEKTRNKVKVYGGFKFALIPGDPVVQLFAEASSVIPELLVDKTVVVSSPGLQKQTFLDIVADRILNTVNSIDDVQFYTLPKFVPDVQVGQVAFIDVDHSPHIVYEGEREITSIETSFTQNGAETIVGIGEKCPRVSVQFPVPPVYATTTTDGVAASFDGGDSFKVSNTGLTGAALGGLNIAANGYGKQMVLTGSGLYNEVYRRIGSGGTWAFPPTFPSDPVNSAGDSPPPTISGVPPVTLARVVDEPTHDNTFHIMANWSSGTQQRTWIYTTEDFGASWNSHAISVSGVEGVNFDFQGLDIKSPLTNNVYVLGNTSEPDVNSVYWAGRTFSGAKDWSAGYWDTASGAIVTGRFDWPPDGFSSVFTFSIPNNRDIAYAIAFNREGGDTTEIQIQRTTNGGESWTQIYEKSDAPVGIAPSTVRPMLDPGSLGPSSIGVVRFAFCSTDVDLSEVPPFPGSRTKWFGTAWIITDNFSGDATGALAESDFVVLDTKENLFGSFAWRTERHVNTSKWPTTYNLGADNKGSFGILLWNDLRDFSPSQEPPYDPDLYDILHLLTFNVNFQAGTVSIGNDITFEPHFGWFNHASGKSLNATSWDLWLLSRNASSVYTWVKEVDTSESPDNHIDIWSNTSILVSPSAGHTFHTGMRNLVTNAVGIITQSLDEFYVDPDGTIVGPAPDPLLSATFAFYHNNKYYWIDRVFDSPTVYSLYKTIAGNRLADLEEVLGPTEVSDSGASLFSNEEMDIRSLE